jgi:hypothetical protein
VDVRGANTWARDTEGEPVSNTSNFDFCIELGLDTVKEIFHLAFKNEALFPHNIGPFTESFSGQQATVSVAVLDDESNLADLSLQDKSTILFSLPIELTVMIPTAPDPSLSRLVISATAGLPGHFLSGTDPVNPDLSISFAGVTPAEVQVTNLTGLPQVGAAQFLNAINSKYGEISHVWTANAPGGKATLQIYDGSYDTSLVPPWAGNESGSIQATLQNQGAYTYLKVVLPIWVNVPTGVANYVYTSFGTITFWRQVQETDTTVTLDMSAEPADPALATVIAFDQPGLGGAGAQVATMLKPMVVGQIDSWGTITEPAFSQNAAIAEIQKRISDYIDPLSYQVYTPQSGTPSQPLSTPVGFCLPADGVVAILLNRASGTAADDVPPDDFLGGNQVALAVSAAKVVAQSQQVISQAFPGVNNGGAPLHTSSGNGTLHTISISPEDDGAHGQSPGHLWVSGSATADIPCWFNVDVDFSGPVFVDATEEQTSQGCTLNLQPRAGQFNVHESCCATLLDILIPVVGWIMLVVVNNTVSDIGGELANQVANQEAQAIKPIPPTIIGIAKVTACLTGLVISSEGFVFPGNISVVRAGTSFQDLEGMHRLPRPDFP